MCSSDLDEAFDLTRGQVDEGVIAKCGQLLHAFMLRRLKRDVLATLPDRNFVLPDRPAQPRVPLVLLSGFSTVVTSAAVRAIGRLGLRGGSDNVRPMFAAAVPNALDKPWTMLLEELEGDHLANPRAPEASE